MLSTSDKWLVKPGPERLPSLDRISKFALRAQAAARKAREFNTKITPEDQEQYVLAGLKGVAKKFCEVGIANGHKDAELLRIYGHVLVEHAELAIKKEKNALIRRNLDLLEAKVKALQEIAKDRRLPDAAAFIKAREVLYPTTTNGNHNGHPETPLLENGFAN